MIVIRYHWTRAGGLSPSAELYLLYLSGFTVHAGEQQPGGLSHVIAVHRETSPVLGVGDRHPDPLHQRGQYEERPVGVRGEPHRSEQNDI